MLDSLILAGDVGGTKTLLGIGRLQDGRWQPVHGGRYEAADFADLDSLLRRFLGEWQQGAPGKGRITRACLGVAGPVNGNAAQLTNLPWQVDGDVIAQSLGLGRVKIVNDFAAAASGVDLLLPSELVVLQAGKPLPQGPRLVLGAGTGLGMACMVFDGGHYEVMPGEGGHGGFAPASLEQDELWRELFALQGRVTAEDVVSGPGLARVHAFVCRRAGRSPTQETLSPAEIVEAALVSGDALCLHTLDLFIECYGQVAGNFAVGLLPRGGVYIAGGIAPRIVSRLGQGGFLAAFNGRGVHSALMRQIPVSVVTNPGLGLLGAALIASRLPEPSR